MNTSEIEVEHLRDGQVFLLSQAKDYKARVHRVRRIREGVVEIVYGDVQGILLLDQIEMAAGTKVSVVL